MDDPREPLADRYRKFAKEAGGESPCFVAWSEAVADDPDVLTWIADLPAPKQQPNLVFAAARWHGVPAPGPYAALREALLADDGAIRETVLTRSTQTNEAGRLATLVPVLATLPGPLALVEVGASAGLCLYPDRYDYDWGPTGRLAGSGERPVLSAEVTGPMPVPAEHPVVTTRLGVDLNPLDVTDDDATAWLQTLVWPEQEDRRRRLRTAIEVARTDPPEILAGDAVAEVAGLVDRAGQHGTPVVLHSAVVTYFPPDLRVAFEATMRELVAAGRCHWVSNEAPGVVPGIAVPEPVHATRFLLALDGVPVAWTHGHGHDLEWL